MTISGFVEYVKQAWKNKPDTSTPVSAERLNHIEEGIKANSDALAALAAVVCDQVLNDPEKIASLAALYSVDKKIGNTANLPNSAVDVVTALTTLNSKFMSYGLVTSLEIDFSVLKTGLYILFTNYEICTVMRYSSNISSRKILESSVRPIALSDNGYKLTITASSSASVSVLFVGQ